MGPRLSCARTCMTQIQENIRKAGLPGWRSLTRAAYGWVDLIDLEGY